jgi:hypothetical protein
MKKPRYKYKYKIKSNQIISIKNKNYFISFKLKVQFLQVFILRAVPFP